MTYAQMDREWLASADERGWILPEPAHWFWRMPVIRRFRYVVARWRIDSHNDLWRRLGHIPTGYDEWVAYAIARGWC